MIPLKMNLKKKQLAVSHIMRNREKRSGWCNDRRARKST